MAETLEDSFCPRNDIDYWQFSVATPGLLSVDFAYEKLSDLQLTLLVRGPKGACMPTSVTACESAEDCGEGETCDGARGGCRRAAPLEACVEDAQCQPSEECVIVPTDLARLVEQTSSATLHRVRGNVAAALPGTYLVQTAAPGANADPDTRYELFVEPIADPDAGEPNDAPNQATPLSNGVASTGYLSHVGLGTLSSAVQSDVDYYEISPGFTGAAVVRVELSYLASALIAPTFSVEREGAATFTSSTVGQRGSGASAERVREAAVVMDGTGPVRIRVSNTLSSYDLSNSYSLTVEVLEDPFEAVRNDTPANAVTVATGTPSASPPSLTFDDGIAANNDQDWFRIDKPIGVTDNSLLYIKAETSAATEDYLLRFTVYQPTGASCGAGGACSGGRCVEGENVCIAPWVLRPSPDQLPGVFENGFSDPNHGDPQRGGLTPNTVEAQLPIVGTGDGILYIVVEHTSTTDLPLPGYSNSVGYTLTLQHKLEPDGEDRTDPDNLFVARPLAPGLDRGDFFEHARLLSDTSYSAGSGSSIAALAPGSRASVGACSVITLQAFDASGTAATGTTNVDISTSSGSIVDNCTNLTTQTQPFALAITGASGTFSYVGPASASVVDVTTTVGAVTVIQALPALSGTAPAITFTSTSDGAPARRMIVGGKVGLRVTLPAAVTTTRILNLTASPTGATITCSDFDGVCPNTSAPGLTNPCSLTPQASCQVAITSGSTYDVALSHNAVGAAVLRAIDTSATPHPAASHVVSVGNAGVFTVNSGSGYISYEGDQDFFTIALPAAFSSSGLALYLNYAASPVDIRLQATRGDRGGTIGPALGENSDICFNDTCEGGGSCDTRELCSQPTYSGAVGTGESGDCVYLLPGPTTLEVWVNDANANDWDTTNAYSFSLELVEGCPSECNAFVCGQ